MSEAYLRPDQVPPADAARVLGFLNRVRTAQELAEAVEIAGEVDIGIAISQRILNAREALGGEFRSLEEVAAIKYVGPERFTELVLTLSQVPEQPLAELYQQLMAEVQSLRAAVQGQVAAVPRYRLWLQAITPHAYVGQPVAIIVQVTDAAGQRQVGRLVRLAATWGRLRSVAGDSSEPGNSITIRTGVDGRARVTLLPPTSELITREQQAALESMLQRLDRTAETPLAAETIFQELAKQYEWVPNIQFRSAVDIYFHDFRPKLLDTINLRDTMRQWVYFESLVMAYVQEGAAAEGVGTSVEGSAVLNLRFKDWMGPWLQTFLQRARQQSDLSERLAGAVQVSGSAGAVLNGVYAQVNQFVGRQQGAIGQYSGRKLAGKALYELLNTGLTSLPTTVQGGLAPALQVAANTVPVTGAAVLANVGQAQSTTQRDLGVQLKAIEVGASAELVARIDGVETQLVAKVNQTDFDSFTDNASTQFVALGANVEALLGGTGITPVVPISIIPPPVIIDPIIIGGGFTPIIPPPIIP